MGRIQSSDGSTMQYLSVLKTKIHESCLITVHKTFPTWMFQIWCLILCSIHSLTILKWRHYFRNSLNTVTQTISQRSKSSFQVLTVSCKPSFTTFSLAITVLLIDDIEHFVNKGFHSVIPICLCISYICL